jgi:hypothetical protein
VTEIGPVLIFEEIWVRWYFMVFYNAIAASHSIARAVPVAETKKNIEKHRKTYKK